ncbi:hypothetical protein F5884DRAFT_135046 [Xylogone sp. PMI_703]|nr:hypothetical protein F5884DRAFT_135046 [Xylogone sp. PMI_703]
MQRSSAMSTLPADKMPMPLQRALLQRTEENPAKLPACNPPEFYGKSDFVKRITNHHIPPPHNGTSLRSSPEACESDMQGHLAGPSPAVSFLIHLQRSLRNSLNAPPLTSIFTFGDAALPDFDETSFILPSEEEAFLLAARYFDFAPPTYRFLHRQTIQQWIQELYNDPRRSETLWRSKYAVILTVFAQGSRYMSSKSGRKVTDNEKSFSIRAASNMNMNLIEAECKKKLFWCAYNLDKYLRAVLGRPCIFRGDESDQGFPSIVDDDKLSAISIAPATGPSYCMMIAVIAHIKLI